MSTTDPFASIFSQQASAPAPGPAPPAAAPSDPFASIFREAPPAAPSAPAASSDPFASIFSPAPAKAPEAPKNFVGKSWDWINKPLADLTREGAGPIERGVETFASGLTSPLSVGLMIGTLGGSIAETGLANAGSAAARALGYTLSATDAAAAVRYFKTAADLGFLTKYGYDVGANTIPQMEMNWADYRAAKTEKDKRRALDKMEEFGTESILGALATGIALRGIAHDREEIYNASPKGRAMANEQLADGVYGYQQDNQLGTSQSRQDIEAWTKLIPEKKQYEEARSAITFNREAHGDAKILEQQAQALERAPEKWQRDFAPVFRAAKRLSPEQIDVRDQIHDVLNATAQYLRQLDELPADYNHYYMPHKHLFEDIDPDTHQPSPHGTRQPEEFLKSRVFNSYFDSIMAGVEPETTDAIKLVGNYQELASNHIARYNFSEHAAGSYMNSGAPMAAPGMRMPGYTRPRDVPVMPDELAKLKKAGKFDELLRTGRIYEVEPKPAKPPAMVGEPGLVKAEQPLVEYRGREIPREEAERAFMWKQRDYVPTSLYVWRPTHEVLQGELPEALTTFGTGPVPPEAIMEPGMKGFPTDEVPRVPHTKVPVYVHPEAWPQIEPMLESTRPKNPLVSAFLKISGETKSDLLSLSPFHWFTVMNRAFEAGMSPFSGTNRKFLFMPKEIDYHNLTDAQSAAIRDGVAVGSTRPGYSGYLEGLGAERESLVNRIPIIGDYNKMIERNLFGPHGWIASLKFDLYDKLKGELMESKPELTDVQAGRIAAAQVNNKFGGLNYTVLGRGASKQHALRAMFLAPDFLESTGRSVLDVAGGHGKELAKALVAFNVGHWLLARGLNYVFSGDTHPETDFSVRSKDGKREYQIRTTLGDFLHFAEKPKEFLSHRVNPIGVRAPAEIISGEDEFGNKITSTQQLFDTLRQVTPIPLQGIFPENRVTQPAWWENPLHSIGIGSRKAVTPAENLARELRTQRLGPGGALEGEELEKAQIRYKLEDDLRTAINARNNEERVKVQNQIRESAKGPDAKLAPEEATEMIQYAHKYPMPIQSSVAHLPLGDALEVWKQASINEKRALRPIIQDKVERYDYSKHTRKDNDTMRLRIKSFVRSLAE